MLVEDAEKHGFQLVLEAEAASDEHDTVAIAPVLTDSVVVASCI